MSSTQPGADKPGPTPPEPGGADPGLVEHVVERVQNARERIAAAGGDPARIRIVAVTKGFGPAEVAAAFAAGLTDIGENYADELLAKWETIGPAATWHFLGSVQRNKVPRLARFVDCWQAIARVVEGEAIRRHRNGPSSPEPSSPRASRPSNPAGPVVGADRGTPILLVEVDTTGLAGRGGCEPAEVPGVVAGLRGLGCRVEGLMTVAPPDDATAARKAFEQVARLGDELELTELSMGMSGDLEQAVAAGSTMVRLGTALFGPRPQRPRL
jgi:PLP dependent protein